MEEGGRSSEGGGVKGVRKEEKRSGNEVKWKKREKGNRGESYERNKEEGMRGRKEEK